MFVRTLERFRCLCSGVRQAHTHTFGLLMIRHPETSIVLANIQESVEVQRLKKFQPMKIRRFAVDRCRIEWFIGSGIALSVNGIRIESIDMSRKQWSRNKDTTNPSVCWRMFDVIMRDGYHLFQFFPTIDEEKNEIMAVRREFQFEIMIRWRREKEALDHFVVPELRTRSGSRRRSRIVEEWRVNFNEKMVSVSCGRKNDLNRSMIANRLRIPQMFNGEFHHCCIDSIDVDQM